MENALIVITICFLSWLKVYHSPATVSYSIPIVFAPADIDVVVDEQSIACLTMNIYHEARGESIDGQYAVADVVLYRVNSDYYPNDVCGVVKQARYKYGRLVKYKCQFSWYCDGESDMMLSLDSYNLAKSIATTVLTSSSYSPTIEYASHYHTKSVNPNWSSTLQKTSTIGKHIFYGR